MSKPTVPTLAVAKPGTAASPRNTARRNFLAACRTTAGAVGLTLFLIVAAIAVVGPWLAPHSSTESLSVPLAGPSSAYPMGTDQLGRDVLSRVMSGGLALLVMAICATIGGVGLGALAGITAAYKGSILDGAIMRVVDIMLAFPQMVFALLLVSVVGPKLWLITLAVALTHAPAVARVIRSAALDVTERDFVRVAELEGVDPFGVILSEVLPNLVSPLMVEIGLRLTYSIGVIAGLGFLGFGQPPPAANWGLMISENLVGIEANPLTVVAPAFVIALLTVGVNTFTDAFSRVAIGSDRPAEAGALVPVEAGGG